LLSARACSFDAPTALFVMPENPDSYKAFVKGDLEILQPGFHTRHLVVAYRYLSGKPLSASEQQTATDVHDFFLAEGSTSSETDAPDGVTAWTTARKKIGLKDDDFPYPEDHLSAERTVPGEDYSTFPNCLDSAFNTAVSTLNTRSQQHGATDPAVLEWLRGQDAVFSNCTDGKTHRYYGPNEKQPPLPVQHMPAAAPANAPLWLRQDRAYQIAAAHFYALDFDAAIAGFRAIAADTASPWSVTARYLVARAYLRKASLHPALATRATSNDQATITAGKNEYAITLALAQKELVTMRAEPRMTPMRNDIDDLLDYVNIRLDPKAQSVTLAHRFLTPNSPRLRQSLIDFTVIHTTSDQGNDIPALAESVDHIAPSSSSDKAAADLVAWVEALNSGDTDVAVSRWQVTHSSVWLAASLMLTKEPNSKTPALLAAARAVSASDPAYLTITFHRLRLSPGSPATRSEVLTMLPQIRKNDGISAVNEFTLLAAATSPTLDDWLTTAARVPAGEDSSDDRDAQPATIPTEDVCGRKPANYSLFDTDIAITFNQYMPLRLLAKAAESKTLPDNLRFQVAQATWARAVMLDKPEVAHRMSPILIACRATWKPVLDTYDAATTPVDRHANGLLALMRFASTEPSVREGEERGSFATFDDFRNNWWCTTVPKPGESVSNYPTIPNSTDTQKPLPSPPPFLTAGDLAEAKSEVAVIRAIPIASTYFAQQALTFMRDHPTDIRTPEILGYANRVLRSTCRNDPSYNVKPGPMNTATFAHALFDALHQHYPHSPWTARFPTWQ
jgi:hypothetical protein